MRHVLAMIDYFLEETHGRVPVSWSDLQNPLNTATELVDTSGFFEGFVEAPDEVRRILAALTDEVIRFTQEQSRRIGDCARAARARLRQRAVRHGHWPEHRQPGDDLAARVPAVLRRERRSDRRGLRRDGDPLLRRLGPMDRGGEGEPAIDHGGRRVHSAHRPESTTTRKPSGRRSPARASSSRHAWSATRMRCWLVCGSFGDRGCG